MGDFAIREWEPSLNLEVKNGDHIHVRTPTQVKQLKPLPDEPLESFQRDGNIPVSQLLDLDDIQYCGRDLDNAILRKGKGSLEVWTLIATRIRDQT